MKHDSLFLLHGNAAAATHCLPAAINVNTCMQLLQHQPHHTPGPAPTSQNRKMVLEESSLFERDTVITFKHRMSARALLCVLLEGILQRNPLSVFMLRSPSLSFCAHCGQNIKQTSIVTALVDGKQCISNPWQMHAYPAAAARWAALSVSHAAMVFIACANSFIFAHISQLLQLAQLGDE